MTEFLWKPDKIRGGTVDMKRCRAAVHAAIGWHYCQCSRPGSIEREGILYCKQHDPAAVADKASKWRAKFDAESKAREAKYREDRRGVEAIAALRQIEAGHNDPRALARSVLDAK